MREEIIRMVTEMAERDGHEATFADAKKKRVNGGELLGISLRLDGSFIGPAIYFEDGRTAREMADTLYNAALNAPNIHSVPMGKDDFDLGCVRARLLNLSLNHDLANDIPSRAMADLLVTYRYRLNENMSFLINNKNMEFFGLDEETLWEHARKNEQPFVDSLDNFMMSMGEKSESGIPVYVVTSDNAVFGASAVLSDHIFDILKDVLKTENILLLPSSVHEMLAISEDKDIDDLREMVSSINRSVVDKEDYLSDTVYRLTREGIQAA